MEKSIETIWKEGFLESDKLIAPKLNNLYNQKSKHIIDKFNRMFRINLIAIIIGSILFLIYSIFSGIPIAGVGVFIILSIIVVVNKNLMNTLGKIDKNVSSYQYLLSFDQWMKKQTSINRKMSRFYYPAFFLSFVLGFWLSNEGQLLYNEIINNPNEIYFVNGIPVFWVLGVLSITGIIAIFSGKIYNFDVKLIYGRIFSKLDDMIADIEELRK